MSDPRDTSQLQFGPGSKLWDYWTKGKGLAKWSGAAHKWATLRAALLKAGVPEHMVDGLTTNIIEHVMPGYMAKAHAKHRSVEGEPVEPDTKVSEPRPRPDLGVCVRAFQWEQRANGDGRTLEGYAAVFNSPAKIRDMVGEFEEVILPGAFTRSLERRTPVLQFEHGRDPRVGAVPIGKIADIREDDSGLYVRARLFDNATVEPVRDAIAEGAITGMSFRFSVPKDGDVWQTRKGGLDLREIREADTAECGPVVFPAYDSTSVSVRSLLAQLDPIEHRAFLRELAEELRQAVDLSGDLSDFTGRPSARSAGGGDAGEQPGNGETPQPSQLARTRDRVLRMKGII